MRAPVLLLDEPLASLDPLARREFLHVLVDAVRADGSTALLSSHVITDIEQACDRLLVLGAGRTLLDLSIAGAIAEHRIVEASGTGEPAGTPGAPPAGSIVGVFPGPAGERLSLVRGDASAGGRPATLEEVVLGHLAAARDRGRRRRSWTRGMNLDRLRLTLRLNRFELLAFGGIILVFIVGDTRRRRLDRCQLRPSAACLVNDGSLTPAGCDLALNAWYSAPDRRRRPGSSGSRSSCRSPPRCSSASRSWPASSNAGPAGSPGRWRRRGCAGSPRG